MHYRGAVSDLRVRTATPEDLERLLQIHVSAFPDARGMAARRRNFADNPLGSLVDLHVILGGDRLLGHAFLFKLGVWFGGKRVAVGGIASVGVALEARGRGIARTLMSQLHAESVRRGDAITMLYAFRYDFYAALGYARTGTSHRVVFSPRAVPRDWINAARGALIRPARGDDRGQITAIYDLEAQQGTGQLDRPNALWDHTLLDERLHTLVIETGPSAISGYVSFEHLQEEPHAAVRVRVRDWAGRDDEARRILLGALGAQVDQVTTIEIDLSSDDPFLAALGEIDAHSHGKAGLEHPFGTLAGGPMVRVNDVERALSARGYRGDGEATFVVDGGTWTVASSGGDRTVRRSDKPGVHVTAPTLGALAFGSLTATSAHRLGWLGGEPAEIKAVDHLLTSPTFFARDHF